MSADRIVEKWRRYIPPRVPKSEVEKVIKAKFPQSTFGKPSSHEWVIYCEIAEAVYKEIKQKLDANEAQKFVEPFNFEGKITIPIVSGRKVKQEYVKDLLKAIDSISKFKEFLAQIKEKE